MKAHELPVYQQKNKILEALERHQVIIVESPTGSGKTTQLPIILHEAGYTRSGMIGVTQPRRIATLSVCEFIAGQLGSEVGELIGYKMRFEDKTSPRTHLKIMTDGTLLQELKTDPLLEQYSVLMVDEAHERSLNIDFILGLLKNILRERPQFKVIISSATINSDIFSRYFNNAPLVSIETPMYPVAVVYDPPADDSDEVLTAKIAAVCERIILDERREGDILIFLPGEKLIKAVMKALDESRIRRKIWVVPLYGMLGKEEQERVFMPPPFGKNKIIVSTNIAETSVTIDGVTSVIDSGRCKENRYNLRTYTSSLIDTVTSQASANQRKGRAGRTRPGFCYRLYAKADFDRRDLFTLEEIYRTDLSEVVLRMAGLGIDDYMSFDFISQPSKAGIQSSIETLQLLEALDNNNRLTRIGEIMLMFPLLPRHARIIVEAMFHYPDVLVECCIATAFLSTNSPYLLPQGEELEARKMQHSFRSKAGDFVGYLNLFNAYNILEGEPARKEFCQRYYLDQKTMDEIMNVERQLEESAAAFGAHVSGGGTVDDFLVCCGKGLIQFICAYAGRDQYNSLTAEHIMIHPGSSLFKENPRYIIAGEIMRTTRTYARSVSPITKEILHKINKEIAVRLEKNAHSSKKPAQPAEKPADSNTLVIGRQSFSITKSGGKKRKRRVLFDWYQLKEALERVDVSRLPDYKGLTGTISYRGQVLLSDIKVNTLIMLVHYINPERDILLKWPRNKEYNAVDKKNFELLAADIDLLGKLCFTGKKGRHNEFLGFLGLTGNGHGIYRFKPFYKFGIFIKETMSSLDELADYWPEESSKEAVIKISEVYRKFDELSNNALL
jgi:ATP-dependent helicase HrpA